jgi:hypothetical protein
METYAADRTIVPIYQSEVSPANHVGVRKKRTSSLFNIPFCFVAREIGLHGVYREYYWLCIICGMFLILYM